MSNQPKYPYPVSVNVANFVSLKLSFSNFLLWETQILSLVESQDLFGFLTGETIQPPAEIDDDTNTNKIPNPDLAAWTRTDRLVKAWMTSNISEEVLGTVVGLKTSNDVWTALKNAFSQDSEAREFELLLKLQEKKKDSTPLSEYIREFKSVCDQLNAIGKPIPDNRKVFSLLIGLGPRYESFSTAMLKPPVPSYAALIPLLQSHELRYKSNFSENANHSLAFVGQRQASRPQAKRGSSSFSSRGRGFTQTSNRSFFNNRPRQPPQQSSSPAHARNSTSTSTVPCQICRKKGHDALSCWHRFDNSFQDDHIPQALAALHLNELNDEEWVPDTGATSHMTDNPGPKNGPSDGIRE